MGSIASELTINIVSVLFGKQMGQTMWRSLITID